MILLGRPVEPGERGDLGGDVAEPLDGGTAHFDASNPHQAVSTAVTANSDTVAISRNRWGLWASLCASIRSLSGPEGAGGHALTRVG